MIAPVKESPPPRHRTALQAARLAVADALLAPRHRTQAGDRVAARRAWILVGSLIALAIAYLLTLDWWTIEKY